MRSPGLVEDPRFAGRGERERSPRGGSRPVPVTCARGLSRSPTLAPGHPRPGPSVPRGPCPERAALPAPRPASATGGRGGGRSRAGRPGRALLFPRAQLGRRFRAAAAESGPAVGSGGTSGGRRPALPRREPADVSAAGGGGRRKERNNGGVGGLSCVRGRSDARAESRVRMWRCGEMSPQPRQRQPAAAARRRRRAERGGGGRVALLRGRGRPRPDYTDTNSQAALRNEGAR
nr:uncharacterized protein LOC116150530 [Camelus dromedarius]